MPELAPAATIRAGRGMVCAVDHLAAGAGGAMLRAGGTAADAAVAASAVLAVTSQHLCGMGGDLLAVIHTGSGPPLALNASGRAGSGADPARLRAEGHTRMPPLGDIRAVPVPGCVDGWLALHERFGRLDLAAVLEPARSYAEEGFPASPTLAAMAPTVAHLPEASDYSRHGRLRAGTILQRPGVARALAAIARDGRRGFYEGEFGAGLLALGDGEHVEADLARPQADWVPALELAAWSHRLWTVPPSSQGYLTLAAAWIAEGLPLPEDPDDPRWAHLLIEATRQAAFDRPAVLHEGADGAALLAPQRLALRRAAIDPERASVLEQPAIIGDTIALCAVDHERRGVSLLQSNAAGFGCHLVVPGVRIFLHDRGVGFSLQPGHPAEYGPGRRPPHTLSPTLVTAQTGELRAVTGTMGGDSQPQILLQVLARALAVGQGAGDAIAAGRWALAPPAQASASSIGFDTWDSGGQVDVRIEGHAPLGWDSGLRLRGHSVVREAPYNGSFGHAHLIAVHDDHLAGATDPRPRSGGVSAW
ncbi:MAG TPA: gamma-glutamyltransferase [Acidimicrobiales bacterium]